MDLALSGFHQRNLSKTHPLIQILQSRFLQAVQALPDLQAKSCEAIMANNTCVSFSNSPYPPIPSKLFDNSSLCQIYCILKCLVLLQSLFQL